MSKSQFGLNGFSMKVLFVCLGNTARSQMAEAFYNNLTGTLNAKSAGVLESTPTMPNPDPEAIYVMKEEGIDISEKKVKRLTREMADEAEEIFALCKKEEAPDLIVNSGKTEYLTVEDPDEGTPDTFRQTRDLIKKSVEDIIKRLN